MKSQNEITHKSIIKNPSTSEEVFKVRITQN
jgi:hypothetical protein